jgi:Domain of unknown function (DUF4136)
MLRIPLVARLVVPLAAAFLLGGCASTLTTQVTSFHQLSDNLQGRRFVIVPTAEQQTSLEFGTYANLVREALTAKGLVDAGETGRNSADLGVGLSYGVTGRTIGMRDGTTGYAGFGAGSGGFSMGGVGIGIGFPIGGGGGSDTAQYQRSLTVQIDRLAGIRDERPAATATPSPAQPSSGTRIFEARAISEGESASLAPVMRAMVQAIFQDFPGPSGTTRVVRLPLDETR